MGAKDVLLLRLKFELLKEHAVAGDFLGQVRGGG